ncbi:MAG: GUN4 domain-containing protein [Leptolyngbyaceae cyanobacterium bins.302]|nr:GUN4 domain-containing protein [Leptolyngbyaceae cyanobacterium bins.302]
MYREIHPSISKYRNKEERGQGRGVTWEGGLIIAELYDGQGINDKFIPVLLSLEGERHIPRSLQGYTVYRVWNNSDYDINKQGDYQNLYRHLTKQPAVVPARLGKPQILPPIVGASSTIGNRGEIIQSNTDSLSSDRGIDYTQLRVLLQAGQWQAADQETTERMCEVMGRQKEGWLSSSDIKQFPSTDLRTINRLWVKYSEGKFGFSVQKTVWQQYGSLTSNNERCEKLGEEVGWKNEILWKALTYDEPHLLGEVPKGCFPFKVIVARFATLIPEKTEAPKKNIPFWRIRESLSEAREKIYKDIREAWRTVEVFRIASNKDFLFEIIDFIGNKNVLENE